DVGGHSGAIADVVADVICDGGGVSGVVFVEVALNFADKICADVGGFGVDAAAEARKDADEAGAEGKADEAGDGFGGPDHFQGDEVVPPYGEKGKDDDEETGDDSALEG